MVVAACVAAALTWGYVTQSRAQTQLSQKLDQVRLAAVQGRAETLRAGVPPTHMTLEDRDLARLAASAAPARVPFLDGDWRSWVDSEASAYHELAIRYAAEATGYTADLSARLDDSLTRVDATIAEWTHAGGAAELTQPLLDQRAALLPHVMAGDINTLTKDLKQAAELSTSARDGLTRQAEDNAAQARYAQAELPGATANLAGAQQAAAQLTAEATGNAEAAVHFNVPGASALAARIDRHAAATATADPQALANAMAWVRVDQDRLAAAMAGAMPDKAIYISTARQELRAYDHGKVAQATLVTTGRPELPTVVGSFSVMSKSSPWTMHSPFSYSSGYWYPDTRVQMVLWFHEGGYGIHDAYWRSHYGPGTNVDGPVPGTHGCVNVPWNPMAWLYDWAQVGTPVTVG